MSDLITSNPSAEGKAPSFEFSSVELEPFRSTSHEFIKLHAPQALDAKGRPIGKAPGKGWRTAKPLDVDQAKELIEGGINVGVRLRPTDLVVDIDPRSFAVADNPVARLEADLGITLDEWPRVDTGSGGFHYYMTIEAGTLVRDTVEEYPGIEFKAHGRQMVAPGSSHPATRKAYRWDALAEPVVDSKPAPSNLLDLIRRSETVGSEGAGEFGAEDVELMLTGLNATEFSDQAKWLEVMMACHHASGGDARQEFIDWSVSDPAYADDAVLIGRRWDSLHGDDMGRRVTVKTLFKALNERGRGDLINDATVRSDFADELADDLGTLAIDPVKAKLQANAAKARKAKLEKGKLRKLKQAADQAEYAKWLNSTFVRDRSTALWVNVETGEALDDRGLEIEHGPGWAKSNGKGSLLDAIKKGRAGIDIPSVRMCGAFPGKDRMVSIDMGTHEDVALNSWYDTTLAAEQGDASWWRQEIERLFPGDQLQQEILMDYWAARCLEPGRKIRWALVLESAQGAGKGMMKIGLSTLLGWRNCGDFGRTQMTDKYDSWRVSAANLFGEEIGFADWKKAREAYEGMKAPITEDFIAIRPMHKESQLQVPNGSNYIFNRNPEQKFYISPGEDERRFCYLRPNPEAMDERAPYFAKLKANYQDRKAMAAVRWWLVNEWAPSRVKWDELGLDRIGVGRILFDTDPPMTPAKASIQRESLQADGEAPVDFQALEREMEQLGTFFTAEDVLSVVKNGALDRFDASEAQMLDAIRKWLKVAGFAKGRNKNGQGVTIYYQADDAAAEAMGPTEREMAYLAKQ